ncbi:MAG TPA: TetR/AcrR family transcriptional regulator [Hyphomonadaceae bacterium]|nr:TetR/AcrR family transcriptional regulator [Hyphomonadaceae bacterium]
MAKNDNSVNIENAGERYHHGDLRAALIEEALKRLESGPAEALSLREVARNVGVSATAVYRHFPDKAALLDALCAVADERLADAFEKAMAKAKPGRDAFNAMGRAYVRFALANPSLFRQMMSTKPGKGDIPASRGREILARGIADLGGPDASKSVQDIRRLRAWSMVHGLAMLMLDGLIPPDERIIETVVDSNGL